MKIYLQTGWKDLIGIKNFYLNVTRVMRLYIEEQNRTLLLEKGMRSAVALCVFSLSGFEDSEKADEGGGI